MWEGRLQTESEGMVKAVKVSQETYDMFARVLPSGQEGLLEGRICDGLCRGKVPLLFNYDCFQGRHARSVCDVSVASHLLTRGKLRQRELISEAMKPTIFDDETTILARIRNDIENSTKTVEETSGTCPRGSKHVDFESVEYCVFEDRGDCVDCCGKGFCESIVVDGEEDEEETVQYRCGQQNVLRKCFGGDSGSSSSTTTSFLDIST